MTVIEPTPRSAGPRRGNLQLLIHPHEPVEIGDDITVTVIRVERDRVTLAIEAPRDIPILRAGAKRRESTT